jgi:hypothetical protein
VINEAIPSAIPTTENKLMKETKLRLLDVFEYRKPIKADIGSDGSKENRISLFWALLLIIGRVINAAQHILINIKTKDRKPE